MSDGGTTEMITVEVEADRARELEEIAWSYGIAQEELLRRSFGELVRQSKARS